ncbi:circularly permuted type 2 ATP-grasp protein [Serinibacter arcticus]|uniref:Protein containing domains DUF404, DUF407 n=1 Tax=Serinibacter arcticus TaxID=1655435 RepID=A0A4Z1E1H6_9MICO|nr:circularly permuted type 2 ATP-grasp protein [Serinibacter arcticus]TGO04363.1 Protein containing domains DUF404, DUF407 [Serinibacter arcticus]
MADLFEGYPAGTAWDEMTGLVDGDDADSPWRSQYAQLRATMAHLSPQEMRARGDALARSYLAQGVTFDIGGEERPFPLDPVPRVLDTQEWNTLAPGVAQRVRALEKLLDDIYGRQKVVTDGVIPRALITSSAHFHRQAKGIVNANGVRVQVAGIDVIRDDEGGWRVLEDNVRVPSGVSYVLSNRRSMAQTFPELFSSMRVRPVADYPRRLLAALTAAAPNGVDDPVVVVLTPGVYNSAYFEHSLLARLMGVELVEGRDLFVSGGRVYMRTTEGRRRVDVIYRRVDDEFIDPVAFRQDSLLGCPGLLGVARLGNVSIANAIGNGVADDKLMYTYVPDLIRYYLGEEPLISNVDTWRLEEPEALSEVLDRLDELVVKPVDGSGGKGIIIGPAASRAEIDEARTRLRLDPRGWIAQPVVQLSTVPTLAGDRLRPRHVDLRPFAVNDGNDVWVLPGGLTRVALQEGQLVVNSSQGGGSKDTWVSGPSRWTEESAEATDGPREAPALRQGPAVDTHPEARPRSEQHEQQQQTGAGRRPSTATPEAPTC